MLRLRSYTKYPPGGFDFRDPSGRYFQAEGGIRQLANRVSEYRQANRYPNATWEEAYREIELYVIDRIGNDPRWVEDTDVSQYVAPQRVRATGGCCGAKVT